MEPAEVFSVAEYIADELEARGWTTRDLAARMSDRIAPDVRLLALDLLLACGSEPNVIIDDADLCEFATAFDVSPDMFRHIYKTWKENPERQSKFECPDYLLSQ